MTDEHRCFELDGARVHGDPNMSDQAKDAIRQVIAAAKARYEAEQEQENKP